MKNSAKYIGCIETDSGEVFRCGDFITVVLDKPQGRYITYGRLAYADREYFTVDSSTPFHAMTVHFYYQDIDEIHRAEPPKNILQGGKTNEL